MTTTADFNDEGCASLPGHDLTALIERRIK